MPVVAGALPPARTTEPPMAAAVAVPPITDAVPPGTPTVPLEPPASTATLPLPAAIETPPEAELREIGPVLEVKAMPVPEMDTAPVEEMLTGPAAAARLPAFVRVSPPLLIDTPPPNAAEEVRLVALLRAIPEVPEMDTAPDEAMLTGPAAAAILPLVTVRPPALTDMPPLNAAEEVRLVALLRAIPDVPEMDTAPDEAMLTGPTFAATFPAAIVRPPELMDTPPAVTATPPAFTDIPPLNAERVEKLVAPPMLTGPSKNSCAAL